MHKHLLDDENFNIGQHVVVKFVGLYNIKMRHRQRNKKADKESFHRDVMKWNATTRENLILTGFSDGYDSKWGHFELLKRFNSPCS